MAFEENDADWAEVHALVRADSSEHRLTDMDAQLAWKLGLAALQTARGWGAAFPHNFTCTTCGKRDDKCRCMTDGAVGMGPVKVKAE